MTDLVLVPDAVAAREVVVLADKDYAVEACVVDSAQQRVAMQGVVYLGEVDLPSVDIAGRDSRVVNGVVEIQDHVAIHVLALGKAPAGYVAAVVAEGALVGVVVARRIVAVAVHGTGAVVDLPPVVGGQRAVAHNAVEVFVDAWHEAGPVAETVGPRGGAVRQGQIVAVIVEGDELFAFVEVHLALFCRAVAWHAPAGVDAYGRNGDVPAHTEPAVRAFAIVSQCQGRLHAATSVGNSERIVERHGAVAVG